MADDFDLDDDDFGLDDLDDLNFDGDDLDNPGKGRKPVERLTTGFLQGARDTALNTSFQKKVIDEALPPGYGHTHRDIVEGIDTAKQLYDTAKESIKPAKAGFKKLTRGLANKAEGILPKKIKDKIDALTEPSESSNLGNVDYNALEISNTLKDIFGAQSEVDEEKAISDAQDKTVRDAKDDAKFKTTADMLVALRIGQDRLVSYQDNITSAYQRKSLELQYKHYFVAREQFVMLEGYVKDNKLQMDSLVHNSALPDMVKMRKSEALKEQMRDRFYGGVANTIQEHTAGLRGKILDNVKGRIKGLGSQITEAITSAADMQEMMDETEGVDNLETAGAMVGGSLLDRGATWLGGKIGKHLKNRPGVKATGDQLEYMSNNKTEWLKEKLLAAANYSEYDDEGNKKTGIGNKMLGMFSGLADSALDLIPGYSAGFTKSNSTLTMAEDAATWSVLNDRTLNEIIPGYLSSILQELEMTRTGDENIERNVFNFEKGHFSRESDLKSDLMTRLLPKRETESVRSELMEVLDIVDPDGDLSEDAREALTRQMLMDVARGDSFNPVRYFGYGGLSEVNDPETQQEIRDHIAKTFLNDSGGMSKDPSALAARNKADKKFKSATSYIPEYKERAMGIGNTYGSSIANELGLFTTNDKDSGKTLKELKLEELKEKELIGKMTPEERLAYRANKEENADVGYDSMIGNHRGILANIATGEELRGTKGSTPTKGMRGLGGSGDLAVMDAKFRKLIDEAEEIKDSGAEAVEWLSKISKKLDDCCDKKPKNPWGPNDGPPPDVRPRNPWGPNDGPPPTVIGKVQSGFGAVRDKFKNTDFKGKYSKLKTSGMDKYADLKDKARTGLESTRETYGELREYLDPNITKFIDVSLTKRDSVLSWLADKQGGIKAYLKQTKNNKTNIDTSEENTEWLPTIKEYLTSMTNELVDAIETSYGEPEEGQVKKKKTKKRKGLLGSKIRGFMGNTKSRLKTISTLGVKRVKDIYVAGSKSPALEARKLKAGEYKDQLTGKVVRRVKDIKGTVVDSYGNVVLDIEDIKRGLLDSGGKPAGKGIVRKLFDFTTLPTRTLFNTTTTAFSFLNKKVKALGNRFRISDIYVGGNPNPVLEARKLKAGEYRDQITNKVIKKIKDIKGPVVDSGNNVVLTAEDIDKGLYNTNGQPEGKGLLKKGLGLISGAFGIATSPTRFAFKAMKAIANKILARVAIEDIYLKGMPDEPILLARDLKAGRYKDKATGVVIKRLKDIKGAVVDSEGNVVITDSDVKDELLVTKEGASLKSRIGSFAGSVLGFGLKTIGKVLSIPGKILNEAIGLTTKARDVYVRGETEPRIYVSKLKNGEYISRKTNKPLRYITDIDGEVIDKDNNIVISSSDIDKGLVDIEGKAIPMKKGLIGSALSLAGSAMGFVGGAVGGLLKGAGRLIKGGINGVANFFENGWNISLTSTSSKQLEVLEKIHTIVEDNFGKKKFDTTGDGMRDGSWASQKAKRLKDKEAKKETTGKKKKKDGKGMFGGALSMLGGLFGKKKEGDEGGEGGSLLSDAADAALLKDSLSGNKRPKRVKKPKRIPKTRLGRLARGAGRLAGGATRLAGLGSLSGVATGALGAAKGAALAIGGLFSAPVLIGVAAIAAVGAVGYLAYKFLWKRPKGPIHKIRLTQYGVDPNNKKQLGIISGLEKEIEGDVKFNGEKPELDVDASKVLKYFGIKENDTDRINAFQSWFNNRFKPVYLLHRAAAKTHAEGVKNLMDLDKKLKDINAKLDYLNAVKFPAGDDPYGYITSPFGDGKPLKMRGAEVKAIMDAEIAKLIKKGAKATPPEPKPDEGEEEKDAKEIEEAKENSETEAKEKSETETKGKSETEAEENKLLKGIKKGLGFTPAGLAIKGGRKLAGLFGNKDSETETEENKLLKGIKKGLGYTPVGLAIKGGSKIASLFGNKKEKEEDKKDVSSAVSKAIAEIKKPNKEQGVPESLKLETYTKLVVAEYKGIMTPLIKIRMKTYGLVAMDPAKVGILMKMEEYTMNNDIAIDGNKATFNGKPENYIKTYGHLFNVKATDEEHVHKWITWLTQRFIPTLLSYVGAMKQFKKGVHDDTELVGEEKVFVADAIFTSDSTPGGSSVWNVTASPWKNYALNNNSTTIDSDFMALIKDVNNDEKLIKDMVKEETKEKATSPVYTPKEPKYEEKLDLSLNDLKETQQKAAVATAAQRKSTNKGQVDALHDIKGVLNDSLAVQKDMLKVLQQMGLLSSGGTKHTKEQEKEMKDNIDTIDANIPGSRGRRPKQSKPAPVNMGR